MRHAARPVLSASPVPVTPADLVRSAGRRPLLVAAFTGAIIFSTPALAQNTGKPAPSVPPARSAAPVAPPPVMVPLGSVKDGADPRDPMKPGMNNDGAGGGGDQAKVKVSEHQTVDLHVKNESITNVLEMLAIQGQKNIIASKSVSGTVSADLYNVTFFEALDAILHVNGFGYIQQGNFIYVYTVDELSNIQKALSKKVAKVIRLNYLNAADALEFVLPLKSEVGEIKASTKAEVFAIQDKTPSGKDDYALGAVLVVIDYEENIAAIEKLLVELDTRPSQVLVEATILQTSLSEANAFGVDFSLIGDVNFLDFVGVGGPRNVADALIRGGAGSVGGLSPDDNQATAITSTPGNTTGPASFKLGIIADDLAVFLRALDEVTDTTILSNPKILALNRQPARVLVGRRVGYLNTTSSETSTTQTVEFLDTGTQLYFRPFVSTLGEIRMELKPQVSEAIIRDSRDASGASVSIPDEVTQEIVTNVNVRDGSTIVLGGLFRESTQTGRSQVPILGDIPLIGAAFRGHDDSTQRSEIIFLITPTIVNDGAMAMAGHEAQGAVERIRAGARQGTLFFSRDKMTASLNIEAEKLAREGNPDQALWNLKRSLTLNANQPDALRLRERITGEREVWPTRSNVEDLLNKEVNKRLDEVKPGTPPFGDLNNFDQVQMPREPIAPAKPQSNSGEPRPEEQHNILGGGTSGTPAVALKPGNSELLSLPGSTNSSDPAVLQMMVQKNMERMAPAATPTPTPALAPAADAAATPAETSTEQSDATPTHGPEASNFNTNAAEQPGANNGPNSNEPAFAAAAYTFPPIFFSGDFSQDSTEPPMFLFPDGSVFVDPCDPMFVIAQPDEPASEPNVGLTDAVAADQNPTNFNPAEAAASANAPQDNPGAEGPFGSNPSTVTDAANPSANESAATATPARRNAFSFFHGFFFTPITPTSTTTATATAPETTKDELNK